MSLFVALTLLGLAIGGQAQEAGAKVYARVADSVLLVTVENDQGKVLSRGSAFVVDGGRLVTNAHVVEKGRIFVKSGAFKIACTVEKIDHAQDLAILKPSAELSARPLALASKVPPSGSTVFALGNPQGLERSISQGLLTGTRLVEATQMLQVSAAISPGSSGGPVVLPSGEVIGVATSSLTEGQSLNFAVPASAVRALMDRQAGSTDSAPSAAPSKLIPAVIVALEKSKLRYQKASEGAWMVTFEGTNSSEVGVYIIALEEMVMISSLVSKGLPGSDALLGLLQANYAANFSKLAIDDDGDILALTELPSDFSAATFKLAIEEVAGLADKATLLVRVEPKLASAAVPVVPAGKGATVPLLRGAFEVAYDPAKWRMETSKKANETEFEHVSGDAGFKIITDRVAVDPGAFREVVLSNAKEVDANASVVSETTRTVNGSKVTLIRYAATASGVRFTFYNQLYSDAAGTVQIVGYTGANLFEEYQRDFLELFAGFRKTR